MTTFISPVADQANAHAVSEFAEARLAALLAGAEAYSTAEVAGFFGKTDQWVYWVLRVGVARADGTIIEPERVGRSRRRRFTKSIIEEIAAALYRRGTLNLDGLRAVLVNLHQ